MSIFALCFMLLSASPYTTLAKAAFPLAATVSQSETDDDDTYDDTDDTGEVDEDIIIEEEEDENDDEGVNN